MKDSCYMYNDNSKPVIKNSLLWGNASGASGRQIYATANSAVQILDSLLEGGCAGIQGGGGASCANLQTVAPLFVAPQAALNAPTASGDYRLQAGSPGINAGNNSAVSSTTDLDGKPRITGGRVDMGAYETQLP